MRDIRPDIFERISQATKAVADARYVLSLEINRLEASHQPEIDRLVLEIEQLTSLLNYEQKRSDLATLANEHPEPAPKFVSNIKVPIPTLSEPIKSEADAKWRLDRLSELVRAYVQKDEVATNVHRLPTEVVPRTKSKLAS